MNWPLFVHIGMEWIWSCAGILCLGAAAALAAGTLSPRRLEARLAGKTARVSALLVWGVLLPAVTALFKLAQFHSFELMTDSAVFANMAWRIAYGFPWVSSLYGDMRFLADHFALTVIGLAPILRVWESAAPLALLQGACVGSSALALFLIARRVCARESVAWILTLLAVAHPFYQGIAGGFLDNGPYALPFFLWAAACWHWERRLPALGLALLLLTTREHIPFIFFGLGAWLAASARERRGRALGCALAAVSIAVWFGENALIQRAKEGRPEFFDAWVLYEGLGASRGEVLANLLRRPWLFAWALVHPAAKLWTPLKALLALGFLPLGAGPALLPALCAWLPHQLAGAPSFYHQLSGRHAAYVYGPLLWAMTHGAAAAYRRWSARESPLSAALLACAGASFLLSGGFLLPPGAIPAGWRQSVPAALAGIPTGAAVWGDQYLLPHLAMRPWLKALPEHATEIFEDGLFAPDRVLYSTHWLRRCRPEYCAGILAWLEGRGYRPIFAREDLVLLARPDQGPAGDSPEPLAWPP